MDVLSKKQKEVFEFLKKEIKAKGFPPSVREICAAVNLSSTSTVHAHLESLERKGYIRRNPTKNRSIEILEENFYNSMSEMVSVPLIGKVTAGEPILARENIEDTFPIPFAYLNKYDDYFMLRVKGDSMIEKGIQNGDMVIVRRQQSAGDGDMVVALIDDSATIKTFFKGKDNFRLEPANPAYEPIIVDDLSILGKITGLIRFY